LNAEKLQPNLTAVNCYRKVLGKYASIRDDCLFSTILCIAVCDVLPLVLEVSLPPVMHKDLFRWLQKSIEFYVAYLTQPHMDSAAIAPSGLPI
jgi:integrator complex subunit 10